MITGVFSVLLAATASVQAHATFQQLWVNGVDQAGSCVRAPASNSPVASVTSTDIACNAGAASTTGICTVAAGQVVAPEMHQQPGDRVCTTQAIGGAHHGPTIVYLAKVDNAATAVGSSAKWFKIFESGLITDDPIPGYWGNDAMNDNCGKVPVTIPADIAPGDYLLRAETIALHAAGSAGGAQFYMSCYQLRITGSGTATPAGVSFPGAYSASDPGILISIYQSLASYTVPGPTVYKGAGGSTSPVTTTKASGATTTKASTPTTTTTKAGTTTTTKAGTTSTKTSTSAAAGSTALAQQYGQCGGIGWTGPTACVSPFVCTANGAYYSQCL